MLKVFDTVLTSNDLSVDRVLNAGLPVVMVFYDRDMPSDLRQKMEDLARQYAGKVLVVILARSDAAQAASRFGVRQFPTLVTIRDGKTIASLANVRPEDLKSHIAYLLGEGPLPAARGEHLRCRFETDHGHGADSRQRGGVRAGSPAGGSACAGRFLGALVRALPYGRPDPGETGA